MYVNLTHLLIIFHGSNTLAFRTITRDITGFIVIRRAHHIGDICNIEDTCLRETSFLESQAHFTLQKCIYCKDNLYKLTRDLYDMH